MKAGFFLLLTLFPLVHPLFAEKALDGALFLQDLLQNEDLGDGVVPLWAMEFEGSAFKKHRQEAEAEAERKKIIEHLGRAGLDPGLEVFDPFFLNIFRSKVQSEVQSFQSDGDFFTDIPNRHSHSELSNKYEEEWLNVKRESQNLRPVRVKKINGIDYMLPLSTPSSALLKAKHTLSPQEYAEFELQYDREAERILAEEGAIAMLKDSHTYLRLRFLNAQKRIGTLRSQIAAALTAN